jgi:histidinol dehydrogenase
MIEIYTVSKAQQTILRRDTAFEPHIPESIQAGLRRVFGEDISPETAVSRILADVRRRGDEALRQWTYQIDGVDLVSLAVMPSACSTTKGRSTRPTTGVPTWASRSPTGPSRTAS